MVRLWGQRPLGRVQIRAGGWRGGICCGVGQVIIRSLGGAGRAGRGRSGCLGENVWSIVRQLVGCEDELDWSRDLVSDRPRVLGGVASVRHRVPLETLPDLAGRKGSSDRHLGGLVVVDGGREGEWSWGLRGRSGLKSLGQMEGIKSWAALRELASLRRRWQ